jgi:cell surface protein SprA
MVGFIRFGNDFTQNFYQIETFKSNKPFLSLNFRLSPVSADLVWPEENEIDLSLALLTKLKILAMSINRIHLLDGFIIQIMIWLYG